LDTPFIVGIDLGTTNSALASVSADPDSESVEIQVREIPQLVNPGEVASLSLLPSFLFIPGEYDFPEGTTALPWDATPSDVRLRTPLP